MHTRRSLLIAAICAALGVSAIPAEASQPFVPRTPPPYQGLIVEVYYHRISKKVDDFVGVLLELRRKYPHLIKPSTYWAMDAEALSPVGGSDMKFPNIENLMSRLDGEGRMAKQAGVRFFPSVRLIFKGDSMVFDLDEAEEKILMVLEHLQPKARQPKP